MNEMGQHLSTTDLQSYEPPAMEILGSIADLTAGGTGSSTDSCNASSFSISEVSSQPQG